MTAAEQIKNLTDQIRQWDDAYYGPGDALVGDAVYDAAKMQLSELEKAHPELVAADSPTKVIGQPKASTVATYRKVAHHVPMLSLNTEVDTSIKPIKEFLEHIGDSRTLASLYVVGEPKFDGLGLDLQYTLGDLKEAVTRGDGQEGEDVLRHVLEVESIPKKLPLPLTIDVRGEILISRDDLKIINEARGLAGERLYANARNAAAGIMRRKDTDETHRCLRFMAYEIAYGDLTALGESQHSHVQRLDFLDKAGFKVRYRASSQLLGDVDILSQSLMDYYNETLALRDSLPYDIDGIVYKVDDIVLREELGFTGREPNWAIAHKFVPEQAVTRILAIKLGVGKTGRITPVAQLLPVFVGGAVVSNATLVHEDRIKELDLAINDNVVVQRAGDVIPEIVGIQRSDPNGYVERFDLKALFSHCPECKSPLTKVGAFYICTAGSSCPAQTLAVLEQAVSRQYLNIQGLGEATIEALYGNKDLQDVGDLFTLTHEKLVAAGVSPLLTSGILEHIQKAKGLPLWRVFASLGISGCGKTSSKELVKKYSSLAELEQATIQELQALPDIGPISANNIVKGLSDHKGTIAKLKAIDSSWSSTQVKSNGQTVCITGSVEGWERSALKAKFENLGYKTVDSVSKKTDILVAGAGAGGKLAKATELGVRVITTPDEIYSLLG